MSETATAARFREPSEGAFTLASPPGWRVQGGVARSPLDARPWFLVQSPGGGAELRGSDPRVPHCYFHGPYGSMLLPGMVPRPYLPAQAFAEEYARFFARERGAAGFEVIARRDLDAMLREDPRPDAHAKAQRLLSLGAEYGGVEFVSPDRGRQGVVDVVTMKLSSPLGMQWSPFVSAMDGPVDEWLRARETLVRIARSFTGDPQWEQRKSMSQQAGHHAAMDAIRTGTEVMRIQAQSGMDAIRAHGERAQMSAQSAAELAAMQSAGYASRQESLDEQHRRNVNGIRQEADLYDPVNHRVIRGAPAEVEHWWTDGADRLVGTRGDENPDPSTLHRAVDLDGLRRRGG